MSNRYGKLISGLPTDWTVLPLSRAAERIVSGGTPSREVPAYWDGQIPWVTPGELTNLDRKYLNETREAISPQGLAASGATLLPRDSLMVTTRATLGSVALAARPTATNQGFKSVVFGQSGEPSFYFHYFQMLLPELIRRSSGTTFLEISAEQFGQMAIPVPPIAEQRRIAEILDTADEAIRSSERLIVKLDQVKQGLLHDLLTRGMDSNGRLRADYTREPGLYRDTRLGPIPTDWKVHLLDEVSVRGSGHTPNKDITAYWNGGIRWVSLADSARLDKIYITETDKEISDLGIANSSAVKHRAGTVILSRDAGVGKSAILAQGMAVSQHFMAWTCGVELDNHYLYYWLQFMKPRFEAIAMGSTIKTIGLPFFRRLSIPLPRIDQQKAAAAQLLAADADIARHQVEARKQRVLKLGLMNDLLTGRVRVGASE